MQVHSYRQNLKRWRWSLVNKWYILYAGFPDGSDGKASACNAGDQGSIPESGRSPGEGNGNPLQHSCLENLMDGGAWQATVHGVAKNWTRLSNFMIQKKLNFKSRLDLPYINMNPPQVYTCSLSWTLLYLKKKKRKKKGGWKNIDFIKNSFLDIAET